MKIRVAIEYNPYGSHTVRIRQKGPTKNISYDSSIVYIFRGLPALPTPQISVYDISGTKTLAILGTPTTEDGYDLFIDNNYKGRFTGTSYNLSALGLSSGTHTAKVRAMSNGHSGNANSALSNSASFTI